VLGASCGGPCHDGDMVGGEALAGTSASTATARIRARERRGNGGELTEVRRACSAARGKLWSRRSGDGDPRRPEAKKATATAPRDAPACVARRRASERGGGAPARVGETRGRRWLRQWRVAATAAFGRGEREQGRKRGEKRGGRPDRDGTRDVAQRVALAGERAGRLVAWWHGGAGASATRLSDWREDNDDWHWASGPAGLLGQARPRVSTGKLFPFCFLFYFSDICSDLVEY